MLMKKYYDWLRYVSFFFQINTELNKSKSFGNTKLKTNRCFFNTSNTSLKYLHLINIHKALLNLRLRPFLAYSKCYYEIVTYLKTEQAHHCLTYWICKEPLRSVWLDRNKYCLCNLYESYSYLFFILHVGICCKLEEYIVPLGGAFLLLTTVVQLFVYLGKKLHW